MKLIHHISTLYVPFTLPLSLPFITSASWSFPLSLMSVPSITTTVTAWRRWWRRRVRPTTPMVMVSPSMMAIPITTITSAPFSMPLINDVFNSYTVLAYVSLWDLLRSHSNRLVDLIFTRNALILIESQHFLGRLSTFSFLDKGNCRFFGCCLDFSRRDKGSLELRLHWIFKPVSDVIIVIFKVVFLKAIGSKQELSFSFDLLVKHLFFESEVSLSSSIILLVVSVFHGEAYASFVTNFASIFLHFFLFFGYVYLHVEVLNTNCDPRLSVVVIS